MQSCATKENKDLQKEKSKNSLKALFPSLESYKSFIDDNGEDSQIKKSILNFAHENGLIHSVEEKDFISNIQSYTPDFKIDRNELSFETLKQDADIQSIRRLTNEINLLVKKHLNVEDEVNNTMFSRLGNEPPNTIRKRNTLRLLAFWIGYERSHLISKWNYEALLRICPTENFAKVDKGTRMAFTIKGDMINEKIIKRFKEELQKCLIELEISYASFAKDLLLKPTELSLNLPQNKANINNLSSYKNCVFDAILIAHQMMIRWSIIDNNTQKNVLSIAICTGHFSLFDKKYLHKILNAHLPENYCIRLCNFTHQCIINNDIRIIFNDVPTDIKEDHDETIRIWNIKSLWNVLYLDFIPIILDDPLLQIDTQDDLETLISGNEERRDQADLVSLYLKSSYNIMLGVEIAKTLFHRKLCHAANDIIEIIIARSPDHLSSRVQRMMNFTALAKSSPTYNISRIYFDRFEKEAIYIQQHHSNLGDDFESEYASGYYLQALYLLRLLRKNDGIYRYRSEVLDKNDVFRLLHKSESILEKGLTIPKTGYRSFYWLIRIASLRLILEQSQDYCEKEMIVFDKKNICADISSEYFTVLNFIRNGSFKRERLYKVIESYQNSVYLRSLIPNIHFSIAAFVWDFFPDFTIDDVKFIFASLEAAIKTANKVKKDSLYIYSIAGPFLIPHQEFIEQVKISIKEIEKRTGKVSQLKSKKEINQLRLDGFKLSLFHLV